ncbi:MAG: hypothetical protein ACTTKP_01580 [Catonella sp.]|uniref:hypothetical protein n=1 Tax=Catonella sp. TaxID=2382125 RepID=UPI003F9EED02
MEIIAVIVFIIIMIAGKRGKGKNNTQNIGEQVAQNVIPRTNNDYNAVLQSNHQGKSVKAFREAGQTANRQIVREETVKSDFTGFNESFEKKKAKKRVTQPLEVKEEMKDTAVECFGVSKHENSTIVENTSSYSWGIFDDFAASDALYLARKDVERRKAGQSI